MAKTYWAPHTAKNHVDYNPDVVEEIYKNDIKAGHLVNCKNVVFLFHLRPHDSVANVHYKYKKNYCITIRNTIRNIIERTSLALKY